MEIITKRTCLTFLTFFLLCSMNLAMAANPESVIEFSCVYIMVVVSTYFMKNRLVSVPNMILLDDIPDDSSFNPLFKKL